MAQVTPAADFHFLNKRWSPAEPCADTGFIKESKGSVFFALADVAGHGRSAAVFVPKILKHFKKNYDKDLVDTMNSLHDLLRGTRGAAAVAGRMNLTGGRVEYVGLGNISVRKFGKNPVRKVSNEGIIGYVIPAAKKESVKMSKKDVLLLYTDGIRDHFDASECPSGFFDLSAKKIAGGIMKFFNKGNDDAGCIVLRYKNG